MTDDAKHRAKIIRDRHKITIFNEDGTKTTTKHESRNKAKKESRRLQMQHDGRLGGGCLRVHRRHAPAAEPAPAMTGSVSRYYSPQYVTEGSAE